MITALRRGGALALAVSVLYGCGGSEDSLAPVAPDGSRAQDTRSFTVNETALRATLTSTDAAQLGGNGAFPALPGINSQRWVGVLNGASYQIEVPPNWNGRLVMYAHGFRGTGATLTVNPPSIRKYLVENGYAWASSSYSKNYYDVRAGVEDTNLLANAFNTIASANGSPLPAPSKVYIIGHSMGGHVAAAAVDAEAVETARHKRRYDGAVPMCGVVGDTELFDFFTAYQAVAQQMAGVPMTAFPVTNWAAIEQQVRSTFFTTFPSGSNVAVLTPAGEALREVVKNLTGGQRPGFYEAFSLPAAGGGYTSTVWGTFGSDGTITGILDRVGVDTRGITYRIDADPAASAALNAATFRVTGDPQANRLRSDGIRWIPKTNARISVPVVTIHTLGDGYVPWSMEQIYKRRADAAGTSNWLVQRAIRAVGHCDFTVAEQVEAFEAMVQWAEQGRKPAGDVILDPVATADPTYGCKFTRSPTAEDSAGVAALRRLMAACPAGTSSPNFLQ